MSHNTSVIALPSAAIAREVTKTRRHGVANIKDMALLRKHVLILKKKNGNNTHLCTAL